MRAGLPAVQVTAGKLGPGAALPIARARIRIAGTAAAKPVLADDQAAVFSVHLEAGPARLHTWFDDEQGEPIAGAYYVYVRRK